jgi:predicted nucleotidyltransferase component of viral defense system
MLKDEVEIREQARRLNLGVEHVVRDVIQARLVGAIFAASAGELVLKGGLAMRTSHRSQRLTKDLDLQCNPELPQARVAGIIRKALAQALDTGFLKQVSITAPKQTDTVQRFKIAGIVGSSHINMTVEVSRRGLPPPEELVTTQVVDLAGQARSVYSYSASAIAASKVVALAAPNRLAARDLYDLDLLITMEVNPPIALLARMGKKGIEEAISNLWDKLELLTWDHAVETLREFLPRQEAARLTESSWEERRLRTGETVERWLREAMQMIEERELQPAMSM